MQGPQSRQEEEFGADTQDVRSAAPAAAPVSKGPSLCEQLRARGRPSFVRGVYTCTDPEARSLVWYCSTTDAVVTSPMKTRSLELLPPMQGCSMKASST